MDAVSSSSNASTVANGDIERIREDFEKAWQESKAPRIEDDLAHCRPDVSVVLFRELLRTELSLRSEAGERVVQQGYCERFPELQSIVHSVFGTSVGTEKLQADEHLAEIFVALEQPREAGEKIASYSVIRTLGEGAFGIVYLARDLELNRNVALKVARRESLQSPLDVIRFRQEAQNAARISHPGVATIYGVAWEHDPPFIVQEYVEGHTLKAILHANRPALPEAVELIADVAETIAHAHQEGVYHRDLKPSNILVGTDGRPRVVDFGLALHEDDRRQRKGECWGTVQYMAPEQVRGESHRLDGRCDIWALGVMLYEMVVGQLPFDGASRDEMCEEILHKEVRPPRQLKPQLPVELERVCLKCLTKRISDRYTTAVDLAADLRYLSAIWKSGATIDPLDGSVEGLIGPIVAHGSSASGSKKGPGSTTVVDITAAPAKIVPKGLRAFDERDADFFLDLIPGPRDRSGLPETIRFWKGRIEERDGDATFAVGLLYGPSGCGKSSLVRAGLLPRLAPFVIQAYVESGPGETT